MVLTSFGLAWLTYRFVEIPVRTPKTSKTVTVSLAAACFAMFALGCAAHRRHDQDANNTTRPTFRFFHDGTPPSELDAFTLGNADFVEQMQNLGKPVIFVMDAPSADCRS
jgi:hypothetical protein